MKTLKVNDETHDELKMLAHSHNLSLKDLIDILVCRSLSRLNDHETSIADPEVDKARVLSTVKRGSKPMYDFHVQRELNRQKGYDRINQRQCNTALFILIMDGKVVMDSKGLYSLADDPAAEDETGPI